jgi:hypothetical protein
MFDLQRFSGDCRSLAPRQARISVPDLAHWFTDAADPVWIVRGLTGAEIAKANDAASRTRLFAATVEALASAAHSDQADALKSLMGADGEPPEDLAKRFDHLTFGSVEPAISRENAVMLFAVFPVVAFQITNKILELTGLGPDLGKLQHSTPEAML